MRPHNRNLAHIPYCNCIVIYLCFQNYFKKETDSPTVLLSPPPALIPQAVVSPSPVLQGAGLPGGSSTVSTIAPVMDDIIRQQMIETLSAQSGMNFDWSRK